MTKIHHTSGLFFAFMAATLNAMIGIFSVKLMAKGLSPFAIAFYKCLFAFSILTSWIIITNQFHSWLTYIKKYFLKLACCAFFGFFVLYFFETNAYQYEEVPVVVFMLLGSATITTFLLSAVINKKMLSVSQITSCIFSIIGLALIFGVSSSINITPKGLILAIIAGIGYGTFLTISSIFAIGSGLMVVNSLMLFGTIYLFFPFAYQGITIIHSWSELWLLMGLSLLPTIGGFWCTVKALTILKSETVQLLELSEPLISLIFSFIFLHQVLENTQLIGGACVLIAIYMNMRKPSLN